MSRPRLPGAGLLPADRYAYYRGRGHAVVDALARAAWYPDGDPDYGGERRELRRAVTWVRGHVPWLLVPLFPKASAPCRDHRWYKQDEGHLACYDCTTVVELVR